MKLKIENGVATIGKYSLPVADIVEFEVYDFGAQFMAHCSTPGGIVVLRAQSPTVTAERLGRQMTEDEKDDQALFYAFVQEVLRRHPRLIDAKAPAS
jgi:hypothetical protein